MLSLTKEQMNVQLEDVSHGALDLSRRCKIQMRAQQAYFAQHHRARKAFCSLQDVLLSKTAWVIFTRSSLFVKANIGSILYTNGVQGSVRADDTSYKLE
jgi:hypothetical protein